LGQAVRERIRREARSAQVVLGVGAAATVAGVPGGVWAASARWYLLALIAFGIGPLLTIIAAGRLRRLGAAPPAGAGADRAARATLTRVTELDELDGSDREQPMARFEGWARVGGGPPRRVVVEGVPPLHVVEEARQRGSVPVLLDPRDPARVRLDWDRLQDEVAAGACQ
jgi:hypothetical protein